MAVESRPVTPGQRGLIRSNRKGLWKGKSVKKLTRGLRRCSGRDNRGHVAVRHRGGGHKRSYRMVDFRRVHSDIPARVERIEYDPNRTAHIALIRYEGDVLSYILAPADLKEGDEVISGNKVPIAPGNAMPLINIPVGSVVHNVEMKPGKGGQIARSAGSRVRVVGREDAFVIIRLSSGEQRLIPDKCMATLGSVANSDHANIRLGKAGRKRWMGRRPTVRGVAMNPVDHPHGGGEGKTSGGRHPVTPWGKSTKGMRTRKKGKPSNRMIVRSRHQKRR